MKAIIFAVAGLTLFSARSFAEGNGHDHSTQEVHGSHTSMNMHKGHQEIKGKSVTLKGELIGLTCFIKHGSKGKTHKSCAKECAEKGLPIGLLSDGKIYQVSGDGHKSLVEAYKPLLKYLESTVSVKGKVFEKNGVKILVVSKIRNG